MSDIKTCPFCGGEPSLIPHIRNETYEVRCLNEGCYEGCALDTVEEAVSEWNKRPESTLEAKLADAIEALEAISDYACGEIMTIATQRGSQPYDNWVKVRDDIDDIKEALQKLKE